MAVNVVPPHLGIWMKWMLGQVISPNAIVMSVFVAFVVEGGGGIIFGTATTATGADGSNIVDCSIGRKGGFG
jgi:hypothetical protein